MRYYNFNFWIEQKIKKFDLKLDSCYHLAALKFKLTNNISLHIWDKIILIQRVRIQICFNQEKQMHFCLEFLLIKL